MEGRLGPPVPDDLSRQGWQRVVGSLAPSPYLRKRCGRPSELTEVGTVQKTQRAFIILELRACMLIKTSLMSDRGYTRSAPAHAMFGAGAAISEDGSSQVVVRVV